MTDTHSQHRRAAWVKRHPIQTTLLMLLLVAVAAAAVADFAAKRRLEGEIAAIRARGEPTHIDDLRSLSSPLDADRNLASALFQAVQPLLNFDSQPHLRLHTLKGPVGQHASPADVEAARVFLNQHAAAIGALHRACELEEGWTALDWRSPLVDMPLYEQTAIRHAARFLSLDALVAVEDGDISRGAGTLLDAFRCAHAFDANQYLPSVVLLMRAGTLLMPQHADSA